jgi:hypothetical protein
VVHWWEVFGTLRWGIICIMQAATHLTGVRRSHELAAIGRRVCENEHDLLLLLPGRGAPPRDGPVRSEVGERSGAPNDAPTARQLIEAVREWLEDDVRAATSGRLQFHARVAANVLAMVERELELGPALGAAHATRLAALGVASEAQLASAIRAGELDDRYDAVQQAVWATVRDKLLVANPRYLATPT